MEIVGYDFGLLLRELREKARLTQKQLGSKLGISEGMVSRYENNMSEPSFDMARSLAAIFNVSVDYLAGMEKTNAISTAGLQEEQTELLNELSVYFRRLNSNAQSEPTTEHELLGRFVQAMFGNKA